MQRITKEVLFNRLYKRYQLNKIEKKYIEDNLYSFINNLYDIKNEVVVPLNKTETFLIRTKYGIYNEGEYQILNNIEGINNSDINITMRRVNAAIIKYICTKKENINELTIFDIYKEKDCLKDLPVDSLDIRIEDFYRLRKQEIYTIGDLLKYDKTTIKRFMFYNDNYLIDKIYSLGLIFIDDITEENRKDLFNSENDINKILNTSMSLLGLPKNIEVYLKRKFNIEKIKDLNEIVLLFNETNNKLQELGLTNKLKIYKR